MFGYELYICMLMTKTQTIIAFSMCSKPLLKVEYVCRLTDMLFVWLWPYLKLSARDCLNVSFLSLIVVMLTFGWCFLQQVIQFYIESVIHNQLHTAPRVGPVWLFSSLSLLLTVNCSCVASVSTFTKLQEGNTMLNLALSPIMFAL